LCRRRFVFPEETNLQNPGESMPHAHINGERTELTPGTTIMSFVASKNITPEHIVIEYNGEIIPRSKWESIPIGDGDSLEIVKFLGGG
jgi:thiamine biosynthesis protein ThiS